MILNKTTTKIHQAGYKYEDNLTIIHTVENIGLEKVSKNIAMFISWQQAEKSSP